MTQVKVSKGNSKVIEALKDNEENRNLMQSMSKEINLSPLHLLSEDDIEVLVNLHNYNIGEEQHKKICEDAITYINEKELIDKVLLILIIIDYEYFCEDSSNILYMDSYIFKNIKEVLFKPYAEILRKISELDNIDGLVETASKEEICTHYVRLVHETMKLIK